MKIKLADIKKLVEYRPAEGGEGVLGKLVRQNLPATAAFKLMKLTKAIETEYQTAEQARVKLVEKYGEKVKKDDGTEALEVLKPRTGDFLKELTALLETEVEIPFEPLPITTLDGVNITAVEAMLIEPLFQ